MPDTTEEQRAKQLIDKLWLDGKVGPDIRAAAKEMFGISTVDDQLDPVVAPLRAKLDEMESTLKAEREERAKEREEQASNKQRVDLESAINGARSRYNLTDEGFDKMVTRMKETGNYGDADAAAAWVVSQTPPTAMPKPNFMPQKLNLFAPPANGDDNGDFSLLHKDPIAYMDKSLMDFVRDPDGYVRETLGQ